MKASVHVRYGPPEHIKSAIEAAFDAPAAVQDHAIEVLRNASRWPLGAASKNTHGRTANCVRHVLSRWNQNMSKGKA